MAQQSLPSGIVPFNGEITLRLTPTYQARCTTKKHEKKPGEFFGTRSTEIGTIEVFENPAGELKQSIVIGDALNYFKIILDLKDDGSGFLPKEAEYQTNVKASDKELQQFEPIKQMINRMSEISGWAIGIPLRSGRIVPQGDVCKILPGAQGTDKRTGGFRVLGTTTIFGRESVVLSGQESISCGLPGTSLNMQSKGWWAFDRQSGLSIASSTVTVASVPAQNDNFTGTEDRECSITAAPIVTQRASKPVPGVSTTNEQRLMEIKSLLDKGLITREQYEQKSAEILKAL